MGRVDERQTSRDRVPRQRAERRRGLGFPSPSCGGRAGFSLLELMVAVAVLLVATLAAFATQVTSFGLMDSSRSSTVAVTDLEMCMEEVLLQSADDMPIVHPPGAPIAGFDGLHLEGEAIVPEYPGYTVGGPVPDPLEVRLTATWLDQRGRTMTQTLTTVKSR